MEDRILHYPTPESNTARDHIIALLENCGFYLDENTHPPKSDVYPSKGCTSSEAIGFISSEEAKGCDTLKVSFSVFSLEDTAEFGEALSHMTFPKPQSPNVDPAKELRDYLEAGGTEFFVKNSEEIYLRHDQGYILSSTTGVQALTELLVAIGFVLVKDGCRLIPTSSISSSLTRTIHEFAFEIADVYKVC